MRQPIVNLKINTKLKFYSKAILKFALVLSLILIVSACTPYNGQLYSTGNNNGNNTNAVVNNTAVNNTAFNNTANLNGVNGVNSVQRPFINQSTATNNNPTPTYYPDNTTVSTSNSNSSSAAYYPTALSNSYTATTKVNAPPSFNGAIDYGIQALFDCTADLGYKTGFTENDYQNCLQLTQATLSDYAFELLNTYILSWADFAIDTALQALGFSNGRSYINAQEKSSQLTSIISTGYRWYD